MLAHTINLGSCPVPVDRAVREDLSLAVMDARKVTASLRGLCVAKRLATRLPQFFPVLEAIVSDVEVQRRSEAKITRPLRAAPELKAALKMAYQGLTGKRQVDPETLFLALLCSDWEVRSWLGNKLGPEARPVCERALRTILGEETAQGLLFMQWLYEHGKIAI